MKDIVETKEHVFSWLTTASIAETKSHVALASNATLYRALRFVAGNKGKTEAILKELFNRLEVDDVVQIPTGKICSVKEVRSRYVYLKEVCGQWTWKDLKILPVLF